MCVLWVRPCVRACACVCMLARACVRLHACMRARAVRRASVLARARARACEWEHWGVAAPRMPLTRHVPLCAHAALSISPYISARRRTTGASAPPSTPALTSIRSSRSARVFARAHTRVCEAFAHAFRAARVCESAVRVSATAGRPARAKPYRALQARAASRASSLPPSPCALSR